MTDKAEAPERIWVKPFHNGAVGECWHDATTDPANPWEFNAYVLEDHTNALVAAAYEAAASKDFLRPLINDQSCGEWTDLIIDTDAKMIGDAIRALTPSDAQTALDRVKAEAEQRGYANAMEAERKHADARIADLERQLAEAQARSPSVEEAAKVLERSKPARDAAFEAMWKVSTETYSLEATNAAGARYSVTGDVVNALWYAALRALAQETAA